MRKLTPIPTDAGRPGSGAGAGCGQCRGCWLRDSEMCRALRASARPTTHAPKLRKITRDQPLSTLASVTGPPAILRSGYLRLETMGTDGRRSILGLAVPGDLVGNWLGRQRRFELEAASDVELCILDRALVVSLIDADPAFRLQLLRETRVQHARQLNLVWQRGALTSRERTIAFLLMALETMPTKPLGDKAVLLKIEISRRDWADLANTTVETISRTLSYCAREGLIECVGPQRIVIRDLAALTSLAGHEPDYEPACPAPRLPCRNPHPATQWRPTPRCA